jgi:hypothetical protein
VDLVEMIRDACDDALLPKESHHGEARALSKPTPLEWLNDYIAGLYDKSPEHYWLSKIRDELAQGASHD